ncbi:hypothetical protein UlMin_026516 [Ulmus minor]
MVKALKLQTEPNPTPYKLTWVKKGSEELVNESCKVSFSIGKLYQDQILCDVLEMDACHMLLGRPWQYDKGAIYDGRKNTYEFTWADRKITLLPTIRSTSFETPQQPTMIIKQPRVFYTHMLQNHATWIVINKGFESQKPSSNDPDITNLLQQFADLSPRELPASLPPLHNVQHQIDFILGSALPNLPHY